MAGIIRHLKKSAYVLFCLVLTIQLTGCGTLLYPERRGQKGGHVDVGVALLDGIGLLLFIIPGVIAFAVDFSNGTIYIPGTLHSSLNPENMKQVRFDPKQATLASLEGVVSRQSGFTVKFDQPEMTIVKLRSTAEMRAQFAAIAAETGKEQLSFVKGRAQ
jgi:hypothetical protein